MRVLRLFLQLLILCGGGFVLAFLIQAPHPDVMTELVFLGFLAFLFALTLALRDETERRLNPSGKRSFKYMGIVLLMLGAFGLLYGFSFLFGAQALPDGNGSCRSICGIILMSVSMFGEATAKVVAFALWSSIGLFLCVVGYKVKNANPA